MRITPVSSQIASELRKIEHAKKTQSSNEKSGVLSTRKDSTLFSSDALKLNENNATKDIVATRVALDPEIRVEKIEEIKKKISDGYYNSAEFSDKLAEKMCSVFGITK